MIRCILLDLDGTLVNTWDLYVEAYIRALEPHLGRRLSLEELIRLRPNSELRLLQRGAGGTDAQRAYGDFLRHYGALHRSHFGGVYPGVCEMLAELRSRRLSIGIVTGKSRAAWEITAAETDLGPFDVVVTDEDVAEAKPDPAGLVLALDRLSVAAGQAVVLSATPSPTQKRLWRRASGLRPHSGRSRKPSWVGSSPRCGGWETGQSCRTPAASSPL